MNLYTSTSTHPRRHLSTADGDPAGRRIFGSWCRGIRRGCTAISIGPCGALSRASTSRERRALYVNATLPVPARNSVALGLLGRRLRRPGRRSDRIVVQNYAIERFFMLFSLQVRNFVTLELVDIVLKRRIVFG